MTNKPIRRLWNEQRFSVLLIMLLLLLLTGPILSLAFLQLHILTRELIWTITFSAVLLFGYFAVSHQPHTTRIALSLCTLAILTQAVKVFYHSTPILIAHHLMGIIFMLFNIAIIFHLMFTSRAITLNIISASLCVYLLLAVVWSQGYSLLEIIEPGSFSFQIETNQEFILGNSVAPFYFSLVTMTTLGYGDIVPVSQAARMMAAIEAFVGQLYIAVLVARLVGLHVSQPKEFR